MAFTFAGNLFQDVHSSIGSIYQQILMTGRIYAPDHSSLTQQIAEDIFQQPEQAQDKEPLFYLNYFHGHEPESDQGLEPER